MRSEQASAGMTTLVGGYVAATVSGNALTVWIKTLAGNDPSPTEPVYLPFRDATLNSGIVNVRTITAQTKVTIASTFDMGVTANLPFGLWLGAFDDAGTVRLALRNCLDMSGSLLRFLPLAEFGLASTFLATFTGTASGFFWGNALVSSKPYRLIARLDWNSGLATPGTWNVGPDVITLKSAGVPNPGVVVQRAFGRGVSYNTSAATIPYDDTIPQIGEGAAFSSLDIAPTSPVNLVVNRFGGMFSCNTAEPITAALFRDAGSDALDATAVQVPAINAPVRLHLEHTRQFGSSSVATFTVRVGAATGTISWNGAGGSRKFGGVATIPYSAEEIMV